MDLVAPNGTACGSEMCGSFGACTGTGCDLTAGTQSSLCSTPACSGGSCSGATNRSMMRGCTRSASCPDACCNALELSDTCGADCTAPVGITFGSRVVTPIIGNPFGIPFDDTCPADMLAQYFSVDYQAEWLRGMWTYCASVSYAPNHAPDPPTYSIAYNGLAFTLPTRGGMGWTTWNCPADQVITGYTGAVTSYMGRSVVDAIELHCSRITMNGRTFPGATFTITTGSSVLVDDPFPPPTTPTLGPYDCPAGMAVHGFVGSYSDGITGPGSPGALESFGMICAPIAPR